MIKISFFLFFHWKNPPKMYFHFFFSVSSLTVPEVALNPTTIHHPLNLCPHFNAVCFPSSLVASWKLNTKGLEQWMNRQMVDKREKQQQRQQQQEKNVLVCAIFSLVSMNDLCVNCYTLIPFISSANCLLIHKNRIYCILHEFHPLFILLCAFYVHAIVEFIEDERKDSF